MPIDTLLQGLKSSARKFAAVGLAAGMGMYVIGCTSPVPSGYGFPLPPLGIETTVTPSAFSSVLESPLDIPSPVSPQIVTAKRTPAPTAALLPTLTPSPTSTPAPTYSPTPLPASGIPLLAMPAFPNSYIPAFDTEYILKNAKTEDLDAFRKIIAVDLKSQFLVAYDVYRTHEGFAFVPYLNTYISSGKPGFETLTGYYHLGIISKSYPMKMTLYGQSWDDPDVPYTMFYSGDFAIHGRDWPPFDDYGKPSSHGCVNVPALYGPWGKSMPWNTSLPDSYAQLLFEWAAKGMPVLLR